VLPTAIPTIIATAMEATTIPTLMEAVTTTMGQQVPVIPLAADRPDRLPKEEAAERVNEK
jgi:hypothetical protein